MEMDALRNAKLKEIGCVQAVPLKNQMYANILSILHL
jgi:hypothetical protein